MGRIETWRDHLGACLRSQFRRPDGIDPCPWHEWGDLLRSRIVGQWQHHQTAKGEVMTRNEAIRQTHQADQLRALGFTQQEADALRRISMTLHRWFELECGDSNSYASWAIERDEADDKPYMIRHVYAHGQPFLRPAIFA